MEKISISALDWVESLDSMESADAVWRSFLIFIQQFGFTSGAIYDQPGRRKWSIAENILSINWPDSWKQRYLAGSYLRRDPVVRAFAHTRQPFTYAESLGFQDYSRADQNIVFEAREHGLQRGFVVPIADLRIGPTTVTMGGEGQELSSRDRAELHFAALYAHARLRALAPEKYREAELPMLSARERECLEWAAMGKTDWEIGEILTIAAGTVGWHIERAKKKYGVSTRIQAVVIAIQSGAILI